MSEAGAKRVDPSTLTPLERKQLALVKTRVRRWLDSVTPRTLKHHLQVELTKVDLIQDYKPMVRVQIWFADGDYR
mgnify:CR=1 FL=1